MMVRKLTYIASLLLLIVACNRDDDRFYLTVPADVGCTDVLNLGGGDSSVMCVTPDARILNTPSAGVEREVVSFVALVAKYN